MITVNGDGSPTDYVIVGPPVYKRFILFSFSEYYPRGGLGDSPLDADTIEEIEEWMKGNHTGEYCYIFDCENRTIAKDYGL